jgi:hypothetical protein
VYTTIHTCVEYPLSVAPIGDIEGVLQVVGRHVTQIILQVESPRYKHLVVMSQTQLPQKVLHSFRHSQVILVKHPRNKQSHVLLTCSSTPGCRCVGWLCFPDPPITWFYDASGTCMEHVRVHKRYAAYMFSHSAVSLISLAGRPCRSARWDSLSRLAL